MHLDDNVGLYHALSDGLPVLPIFVFDTSILWRLKDKEDQRVAFIYAQVEGIRKKLAMAGSDLKVFYSTPIEAFKKLAEGYSIANVFSNQDYEPYGLKRDQEIKTFLVGNRCRLPSVQRPCGIWA